MKKQITIAQAALGYLHSALDSEPVKSLPESRKMQAAFGCMKKQLEAYRSEQESIQKKFHKPKKIKDAQGNSHDQWVVPPKDQDAYSKALIKAGEKPITMQFDVESFSLAKRVFEGIFNRPDKKETGITGESHMKFIAEIDSAFKNVKTV